MNEHVKKRATEPTLLDAGGVAEATLQRTRDAFLGASKLATSGTEIWQRAVLSGTACAEEIGGKCLENAAANAQATLDAAHFIATSRTIPEAVTAYTSFIQRQVKATATQTQELFELSSASCRKMLDDVQTVGSKAAKEFARGLD